MKYFVEAELKYSYAYCYHDLCNQHLVFYDESNKMFNIFIPSSYIMKASESMNYRANGVCIRILNDTSVFCNMDAMNRINIPVTEYRQFVTVEILIQSLDSSIVTFYVKKLDSSLNSNVLTSYVEPLIPEYSLILSGSLYLEFKYLSVLASQLTDHCHINFEIIGLQQTTLSILDRHMNSVGDNYMEPASWFIKYLPTCQDISSNTEKSIMQSYESYSYIEYVLSPDEILKERKFPIESNAVNIPIDYSSLSLRKYHICIWGSNMLDGQKSIWLNQIKHMNKSEFHFSYILSRTEVTELSNSTQIELILRTLENLNLYQSPFNDYYVSETRLMEELDENGLPVDYESIIKDSNVLYHILKERLRNANFKIDELSPLWAKEIYLMAYNFLKDINCDIIVYGNNRGVTSDVVITDTAKVLNIPTVSELLNLFPSTVAVPNYIIGPSSYSIEHTSVESMINQLKMSFSNSNTRIKDNFIPERVVISPAVDLSRFNMSDNSIRPIYHRDIQVSDLTKKMLSIGFVGRLTPEKNPGLFIMTAHALLQKYPNVRFLVIGEGILKDSLIDLTYRLNINWAFQFTGWIQDELPNFLKGLDIIINTSLRGWSETFCIANIEAMSMGVALVTFGVGGCSDISHILLYF